MAIILRQAVAHLVRHLADPHPRVTRHTRTVRDLEALSIAMGWRQAPALSGDYLHEYANDLDLNRRRLRDAEVIGAACANSDARLLLEIGTAHGRMTAIMAQNAPRGVVHTVNIPPEEINEGGKRTTFALTREEIGSYYRQLGLGNVRQILANTANWEPDFGPIDVAFIDGCHDADFVYHDTRKVLARSRPGTIILWHDFCPPLARAHDWIEQVCIGIDRLLCRRLLRGRILHLQDSWIGLYRVTGREKGLPTSNQA